MAESSSPTTGQVKSPTYDEFGIPLRSPPPLDEEQRRRIAEAASTAFGTQYSGVDHS